MAKISPATKNEIVSRTDAVAVVGEYVRLQKAGAVWKGCCPFHAEKTPSFTVNPEKKLYYCFGCQKGGDIINFVMEMDRLSFLEALEALARKAGVPVVYERGGESEEEAREARRREELAELYRRVAGTFQHFLLKTDRGAAALEYIRGRGITDALIEEFRLGFAPAQGRFLNDFLQKKGYSPEFLEQSGLFCKNAPAVAFFRNRLIFPIAGRDGKTAAFGGRILPPADGPKYLNSPDSPIFHKGETLFALDRALPAIRASGEAVICEGYMDLIALHQAGARNAVAPLGTSFTEAQARLLRRSAERAVLLFDGDNAGRAAAAKAIVTCRKQNLACRVVVPPGAADGETLKDPADILRARGEAALSAFLTGTVNDIDFLIAVSRAQFDPHDYEAKKTALRRLYPFLETVDSGISRDEYIKRAAAAFEIDRDEARRDFMERNLREEGGGAGGPGVRQGAAGRGSAEAGRTEGTERVIQMNDELYLLTAVFAHCDARPDLFSKLRAALSVEELGNADAKELYLTFEEVLRSGESGSEAVLSHLKDRALWQYLIAKSATPEFDIAPESFLSSGITRVKLKRLRQKGRDLAVRMQAAKNAGEGLEDLLAEKMFIDETIQELEKG